MKLFQCEKAKRKSKCYSIARKEITALFDKYPIGVGGLVDPCDYCKFQHRCVFRQDENACVHRYAFYLYHDSYYYFNMEPEER